MSVYYFNITYRCNSNCIFCAANHPIDKNTSEISVDEFRKTLLDLNVGSRDRVIINGGEPTVHRDFWAILDAISECGAKIDLYSNGVKMQNEAFAKKLLSYKYIHIRIPLFGAQQSTHDLMTGVKGNFVATTRGLDHLCKYLHKNASLEIKLLLSRATVNENPKIYELITARWLCENTRITLNPLLISECVVQRKDLMIDTYENLMKESEPLISKALNDGVDFTFGLIPYCTYPSMAWVERYHGQIDVSKNMFYASPGYQKALDKSDHRKRCRVCKYFGECNGFSKSYIDYFGEDVIKPIL